MYNNIHVSIMILILGEKIQLSSKYVVLVQKCTC